MSKDDIPDRTPAEIEGDIRRLKEITQDTSPETEKRVDREVEELQRDKAYAERAREEFSGSAGRTEGLSREEEQRGTRAVMMAGSIVAIAIIVILFAVLIPAAGP